MGSQWRYILTARPTPASSVAISNSILTLSNQALNTACYSTNAQGYVGKVINCANGFYTEVRVQANPANATTAGGWPAYWSLPIEFLTGKTATFCELDFYEMYPNGAGLASQMFGMHDWNTAAVTNNQSSNYVSNVVPDANFHVFGTLYLAPSFNGGTGRVDRFIDGVLQSAQTVIFSTTGGASPAATPSNPNGVFSALQNQHAQLKLKTLDDTNALPIQVDYVGVWQLTATG